MSNMTAVDGQMPDPDMFSVTSLLPKTEIDIMPNVHYSNLGAYSSQTQISQTFMSSSLNPVHAFGRGSISVSHSSTNSSSPRYYGCETGNHLPESDSSFELAMFSPSNEECNEDDYKYPVSQMAPVEPEAQPPRRGVGRSNNDALLAITFHLPASVPEIVDMTTVDLLKMLRSEDLNEDQKELIKNIRRRGRNKVAAHAFRMRRKELRTKDLVSLPEELTQPRHPIIEP